MIPTYRRFIPQVLASTAKNLLLFELGLLVGLPTIIIPAILDPKSDVKFTEDQSSWFASIMFIAQPIGAMSVNFVLDPLGRKLCMMLINIPILVAMLILANSSSVEVFYIVSALFGACIGFMEAPTITYIGEISEPDFRGILTTYAEAMLNAGFVFIYICGSFLHWRTATLSAAIIPMLALVAVYMIPETPIWLISKGKIKEAEKSLCWLRGWVEPEAIKQELDHTVHYYHDTANKKQGINEEKGTSAEYANRDCSLKNDDHKSTDYKAEYNSTRVERLFSVDLNDGKVIVNDSKSMNDTTKESHVGDQMIHLKSQTQNVSDKISLESKANSYNVNSVAAGKESLKERFNYFFRREMMHPLLLMLVYLFFTVFNARVTITPYYVLLAKDLNLSMDPFTITVVFSVTTLIGTVICMIVVRWTGKRFLALLTSVSLTVLLSALGYYVRSPSGQAQESTWIPFLLLIVIHIFFGVTVVPWLYMSEIFPFRGRGFATSLLASMFYVYGFFATKLYFHINCLLPC
ncbi:hypothetical protein LSTR_LSTR012068 [Laodelphax striatellus]|uniref:Major facilitator superfamily (MFS) profile domain-containing protein n=1 Tax=Laodelphax striatellus TaxID=195883 RepID=A0A482WRW1_LAOST|nr:hypothetical protein LSTR_LSTR012068 [Laodelphax striatellus]